FADTRNRETLYGKYIFKYHPIYGGKVDLVYNRELLHGIKDNQELVEKTMAGIQKVELPEIPDEAKDLTDLVESDYPFAIDPMPNLYFTRDPFATIGNAVSLNHMFADTRNRETLYGKYIFKYHPIYGGKVDLVYNRE
ncbi:arginine deiminase family protein, partial [Haemophilus influenzae]|uniref:arginine deiminase family protein n=1 Tax=Haemophilus influenzae TaxID=727 RepID=UPI0018E35073